MLAGFTASAGPGPTVSVTGTVADGTLGAVRVTLALYVPGERPATLAETVTVEGAVPAVGLTLSQEASVAAAQVSVPPPVLLMVSTRGAGSGPPAVALKPSAPGLT